MRKRRNTMSQRMADSGKQAGSQLIQDWSALTFRADNATIGPVPLVALNWLAIPALATAAWFQPGSWKLIATAAGLWLLFTLGRASVVMPNRRKSLDALYEQVKSKGGMPRGTASNPVNPEDRINVRKWGAKTSPTDFTIALGDCPASQAQFARVGLENIITNSLPTSADITQVFDWPTPTTIHVTTHPVDSAAAQQQQFSHKLRSVLTAAFGISSRNYTNGWAFDCDGWEPAETKTGQSVQTPKTVEVSLGDDFDDTNLEERRRIESNIDRRVPVPGAWVFKWDSGSLTLTQLGRDDTDVKRKTTLRKLFDDVSSMVPINRNSPPPEVTVPTWMDHKSFPPDHPRRITIDFGSRNLADRKDRLSLEVRLDGSLETLYPTVTWLADWTVTGSSTVLKLAAVPTNSKHALRKTAERSLRNVVESKFGSSRNFVDCDITEWQTELSSSGKALPKTAQVQFGDVDVTKVEKQEAFEQHWDSLTTACDWKYVWEPAEGLVTIRAVPRLVNAIAFPEEGSDLFAQYMDMARDGKFVFGPAKGGQLSVWELNQVPHGLVGGRTGNGKSVALSLVLFYGLYNPDLIELVVCDPKRTDFTWTPEFPSVTKFAATDTEIVSAIAATKQEMERRQDLLSRVGVRNIGQLRRKFAENPQLEKEHGPAPRRLILFIDEVADFLAKGSNQDIEELKDEARADLDSIARLGRAMEVNILAAAQKPSAKVMSTQLRSQLGFRLGVGIMDIHESDMVFNSDHGTRYPSSGVPKGRAWSSDPKNGFQLMQVMFLPDEAEPCPWDKAVTLTGAKTMARQRLTELGYARTEITNQAGGKEPRWVTVEGGLPDIPQPPAEQDDADQDTGTDDETFADEQDEHTDAVDYSNNQDTDTDSSAADSVIPFPQQSPTPVPVGVETTSDVDVADDPFA